MTRPSWHEYFMLVAKLVAARSTCLKRKVGCVIVKNNRFLTSGYNGQIPGQKHCSETYCAKEEAKRKGLAEPRRYCRAVHAEANAIIQAAKYGISIQDAELYTTLKPCPDCIKLIASVGIKTVYYETEYYHDDELWQFWHKESGLVLKQVSISKNALELAVAVLGHGTSLKRI